MADDVLIDCGAYGERAIDRALEYLPRDVFDDLRGRLAFISAPELEGKRLPQSLREQFEIIVLPERIFPSSDSNEHDARYRYFIYSVLHEVARAFRAHLSPTLDGLTQAQADAQEREADDLAVNWFNDYATTTLFQPPLTLAEIEECRKERLRHTGGNGS
jgi:hypothetical protein